MNSLTVVSKNPSKLAHRNEKPAQTHPLVQLAIRENKNKDKLKLNEIVLTQAIGTISSRMLMHIAAPHKSDGTGKLQKCYHNIFKEIERCNKTPHFKTKLLKIAIPCFNVGNQDFDKKEAAAIAINEAEEFLKHNPACHVRFVCYGDPENCKDPTKQSAESDIESFLIYQTLVAQSKPEGKDRLHVVFGRIEDQRSDIIINPIEENFAPTPISAPIFEKGAQPYYTLQTLPVDVLNLVLAKLPLHDTLKISILNSQLRRMCNNTFLWKNIAKKEGVPHPQNANVEAIKQLVKKKVEPVRFGKHFYLRDAHSATPSLHAPFTAYMIPNGVATRVLRSIPGSAVIIQTSGLGVESYFLKNPDGTIEKDLIYRDERGTNPAVRTAKQVSVTRNIFPLDEKVIKTWQAVKCEGLVVNDWGIPFLIDHTEKTSELESLCKTALSRFPEQAFVMVEDRKTHKSFCIYKNEKQQILKLPLDGQHENEIKDVIRNKVEIFLLSEDTGFKFIHPDHNTRDLK